MGNILEDSANVTQILTGLGVFAGGIAAAFGFGRLSFRKTRRLAKNLGRPLAVIPSSSDGMSQEVRLLQEAGFFSNLDHMAAHDNNADNVTAKHRLAILRFDKTEGFWRTYESLKSKGLPVIIYAKPGEIDFQSEMPRIQQYSYHSICNTPIRLLSDVWAIMATWPEAKS